VKIATGLSSGTNAIDLASQFSMSLVFCNHAANRIKGVVLKLESCRRLEPPHRIHLFSDNH
jgi:hypothetical protein